MNVDFVEMEPGPKREERILVDGQEVGVIKITRNKGESGLVPERFMARLQAFPGSAGDIYGHGDSREEAMEKALQAGREKVRRLAEGIEELEEKLLGDR
jgi:hypothetical protein